MSTQDHTKLVHDTREQLGLEPDLTLWLNARCVMRNGKPIVLPGLGKGTSDIVGILAPAGRWICLEAKTGKARPTKEQKLFIELIRRRGGFAATYRSVDDARAALDRARQGLHA